MIKFLLLILIIFSFQSCKSLETKSDKRIEIGQKILKDFESFEESVYRSTKILSTDEKIRSNYIRLKKKVNDLSVLKPDKKELYLQLGIDLKEDFENKYKPIVSELDFPLEFEFYLPNNILWLVPTNPLGDDIKLIKLEKYSLLNDLFLKELKPIFGYEILENVVYYSVIVPIYDNEGKILGAVKSKTKLENILNLLTKELNYEYITLIKKDYLNNYIDSEIYKDYVVLMKSRELDKKTVDNMIDLIIKRNIESNIIKIENNVAVIKKLYADKENIGYIACIIK